MNNINGHKNGFAAALKQEPNEQAIASGKQYLHDTVKVTPNEKRILLRVAQGDESLVAEAIGTQLLQNSEGHPYDVLPAAAETLGKKLEALGAQKAQSGHRR